MAVRYLKPPAPPAPGEIIIKQEPNKPVAPAPPLIIRQQPPRPYYLFFYFFHTKYPYNIFIFLHTHT